MSTACLTQEKEPTVHVVAGIRAPEPRPQPAPAAFRVARHLHEVVASWRLVYNVYQQTGLIPANPWRMHCTRPALGPQTAVFHSDNQEEMACTMTAMVDGPRGLPLDAVYPEELGGLRSQGRRLMETGLFAHARQLADTDPLGGRLARGEDRGGTISHMAADLLGLMRLSFYYAVQANVTDFVVGVHPRHARFYARAFGFTQLGPVRSYCTVNDRPVALMVADLARCLQLRPLPAALEFCIRNPVSEALFEHRFSFHPEVLFGLSSDLRGYVAARWPDMDHLQSSARLAV